MGENLINQLESQICDDTPNAARIRELLAALRENNERRRKVLVVLQEGLAELRMQVKYIVFDLEATRRERDNLRDKLNGKA